jgi:cbb3-type cytochrome oxidase cytochrome c subunit
MKGFASLVLGIFGTFAFSWVGLILVPNFQIGHLDPQMDEEGTDVYPAPKSGMADRGRKIYAANGCVYCHSEQLRPDYSAADIDRTRDVDAHPKWGQRRSAPRDYIFDRPVMLGKERMGPDLSNIGKAAPATEENAAPAASPGTSTAPAPTASASPAAAGSPASSPSPAPSASPSEKPANSPAASTPPAAAAAAPAQAANVAASPAGSPPGVKPKPGELAPYSEAWHHRHLYSPRSLSIDSNMPAYRFLYEKRLIAGEISADALKLTGSDAPPSGWEIVPTYDAKCLVAYLMSLDQSHPLKEVKSAAAAPSPATAPAGSPAAAPSASPAVSPAAGKGTK